MHLDASNARQYRKVTTVKALHSDNGATYHLSWGDLHYPGPHWALLQGGELYGCAEDSFEETYVAVEGEPHTYRKATLIWARQMDAPFHVISKEGSGYGQAGDWLVQQLVDDTPEQWFIPEATFAATYEVVES